MKTTLCKINQCKITSIGLDIGHVLMKIYNVHNWFFYPVFNLCLYTLGIKKVNAPCQSDFINQTMLQAVFWSKSSFFLKNWVKISLLDWKWIVKYPGKERYTLIMYSIWIITRVHPWRSVGTNSGLEHSLRQLVCSKAEQPTVCLRLFSLCCCWCPVLVPSA